MIVVGEELPDLARVTFDRATISARDAQRLQCNSLGTQHAEDIVVGRDEQLRRGAEAEVRVSEKLWVNMTVRTDQRQVGDLLVKPQGDIAVGGVEVTVFREY